MLSLREQYLISAASETVSKVGDGFSRLLLLQSANVPAVLSHFPPENTVALIRSIRIRC